MRTQLFSLALAVTMVDQVTKQLVAHTIPLYGEIVIVPRFFSLSHVLNKGAAFSLFARHDTTATLALAIFSGIVMSLISFFLWRARAWSRAHIAMALILGGAAGNFIDRVRLRAVVDFLAFDLGSYHWPDFNVADSAIVVGSILLAVDAFWGQRQTARE